MTYNRHRLSGLYVKIQVLNHFSVFIVCERNIIDIDASFAHGERFCIRLFRDLRLHLHNLREPAQTRHSVGENLRKVGHLPDRGNKGIDEQRECDQVDIIQPVFHNQISAEGNHRAGHDAHKKFLTRVERSHGFVVSLLRINVGIIGFPEAFLLHAFIGKGLGSPDPRYTGFDFRVDGGKLHLHVRGRSRHIPPAIHYNDKEYRNQNRNDQREPPLHHEHEHEGADNRQNRDEQILRTVVGQLCDLEQISGQTAHQFSCSVFVIEFKIQRLKLMEQRRADVRLNMHPEGVSQIGHEIIANGPQYIKKRHADHQGEKHAVYPTRQKIVHGVPRYQRKRQVDGRHDQRAHHIDGKQFSVRFEKLK